MKFFKMKAILLGTVVGDGFDKEGRVITDMIIHVDPDNKGENGRYTNPIVTEDVAKKLELNKLAERVGEATQKDVVLMARGLDADASALISFDTEADRHAANADADDSVPQPTALSTRDTTNFSNREQVSGDVAGTADLDDGDAAPAPAATGRKRAAAADTAPAA